MGGEWPIQFFPFAYPEQPLQMQELLDCDVVIYCAAAGVQANAKIAVQDVYEINAFIPIKIAAYLDENHFLGKWISFGTYFEIGNNNTINFFKEVDVVTSQLAVPNHYCSSKRLLSRFFNNNSVSINWWHLILPTIYGPRENSSRLIPYIVSCLKASNPPRLSAGNQIRQYIHCKDIVSLINQLLEKEVTSGIYNIASDESIKIADLVQMIFSKFNKSASESLGLIASRDESMQVLLLNADKISVHLPEWQPNISLSDGIADYF